jgi:uncharacterized protein YuzE
MQRFAIICLLFLTASCGSNEETDKTAKPEEWVLTEKRRFDYKLNSLGKPDTTYIFFSKYDKSNVIDSSTSFYISKYKGDLLSDKIYYRVENDKAAQQEYSVHYEYNTNGKIVASTIYNAGKLLKEERYTYNDSNVVSKYLLIQSKSMRLLPDESSTGFTAAANTSATGYDTVKGVYNYDQTKKVTGVIFTDNQGKLVRKDANIYSGNDPLSSHSVDYKGDTLQKIQFERNGKLLHSKLENDSFILYQNLSYGIPISQLLMYKNRKEKFRNSSVYDQKGRKTEDRLYKAM